MTYIAVLFRRSARHWLRLGLGRGEAGGEDRNVCSIWNRSHGTRKLSGKHPLDREKFLSKNKEQRTKSLASNRPHAYSQNVPDGLVANGPYGEYGHWDAMTNKRIAAAR